MRMMTCDCGHMVKEATDDAVMETMWKHVEEAHPEKFAEAMKMTPEEQDKMKQEARAKIQDAE